MPALKFCNHPGCHRKVGMTVKFCPEHHHMERANLERDRPFFQNYKRESYDALYHTKRWKDLCALKLQQRPTCEACGEDATEIHHRVPHRGDEDLFFDINNLVSLCHECHWDITQKEIKERREKRAEKEGKKPKVKKIWY